MLGRREAGKPRMSSPWPLPGAQRPHTQVPLVPHGVVALPTRASSIQLHGNLGRFLTLVPRPASPGLGLCSGGDQGEEEPPPCPGSAARFVESLGESLAPGLLERVFTCLLTHFLSWPFGAMRKPQPRLLIGQSCPWGGQ